MMHIKAPRILSVNDRAQRILNAFLVISPFFFSKISIKSHPAQIIKRATYSVFIKNVL